MVVEAMVRRDDERQREAWLWWPLGELAQVVVDRAKADRMAAKNNANRDIRSAAREMRRVLRAGAATMADSPKCRQESNDENAERRERQKTGAGDDTPAANGVSHGPSHLRHRAKRT